MSPPGATHKFCPTCRSLKDVAEFHSNRSRRDGLMSQCRACKLEARRRSERRPEVRERKRAAARRYRLAHPRPKPAPWPAPPFAALPGEEWRDVPGYEGLYSASSLGRVRSDRGGRGTYPGKVLKFGRNFAGCPTVSLCRGGRLRTYLARRVVAAAFLGVPLEGGRVGHRDGDRSNCSASNLVFVTHVRSPPEN